VTNANGAVTLFDYCACGALNSIVDALKGKVLVARRLRQETTMSLKWIAQRLQMGSWTYVSNLLNEEARKPRQ
jgi:hypothetical protein